MLSCNLIMFFIQQFNQSNYSNWTAVHTSASSDRFRSCFFAKKRGSIYFRARLFLGVMSVAFLGPGIGFPKMGGFPKKEGGFYALERF